MSHRVIVDEGYGRPTSNGNRFRGDATGRDRHHGSGRAGRIGRYGIKIGSNICIGCSFTTAGPDGYQRDHNDN